MAAATMRSLLVFLAVAALVLPSSAQSCTSFTFSNNRGYRLCNSLARLGASLHWTYHASNGTVDIAFRATQSTPGWIAWGINPTNTRMRGTQALVAVVNSNATPDAYASPIDSYTPTMQRGNLSFAVSDITATSSDGVMTIFATITLPNNSTQVNHVWQASSNINNGFPGQHSISSDNVLSYGSLNFLSGEAAAAATNNVARRRNVNKLNLLLPLPPQKRPLFFFVYLNLVLVVVVLLLLLPVLAPADAAMDWILVAGARGAERGKLGATDAARSDHRPLPEGF